MIMWPEIEVRVLLPLMTPLVILLVEVAMALILGSRIRDKWVSELLKKVLRVTKGKR